MKNKSNMTIGIEEDTDISFVSFLKRWLEILNSEEHEPTDVELWQTEDPLEFIVNGVAIRIDERPEGFPKHEVGNSFFLTDIIMLDLS